ITDSNESVIAELTANATVLESRRASPLVVNKSVRARTAALTEADFSRLSPYSSRAHAQRAALGLPTIPTTTIGSFPQTTELRKARAAHRKGELSDTDYEAAMKAEIDA